MVKVPSKKNQQHGQGLEGGVLSGETRAPIDLTGPTALSKNISLAIKAVAALLVWRLFNVGNKLRYLARRPVMTFSVTLASVGVYKLLKPRLPAARQKAVGFAMQLAMKIGAYVMQRVMSSFFKGNNNAASESTLSHLLSYTDTLVPPLLCHVEEAVDKRVGSLKESIVALQRDKKTLSQEAVSERINTMFQQAICSHMVKSYTLAYLFALEHFVLHVSCDTPRGGRLGGL